MKMPRNSRKGSRCFLSPVTMQSASRCQRALENYFIVAICRDTSSTFDREDQVGRLRQGVGPRHERLVGVFQSKFFDGFMILGKQGGADTNSTR